MVKATKMVKACARKWHRRTEVEVVRGELDRQGRSRVAGHAEGERPATKSHCATYPSIYSCFLFTPFFRLSFESSDFDVIV